MDYKSGVQWDYYHPLDRESWMPKTILINVDKRKQTIAEAKADNFKRKNRDKQTV